MLTDSIAKLRERRAKLASEIHRIDDTLARYDEITRAIEEMVDGVVASTPDDVTSINATIEHVPTGKRGPSGSSTEEIVAAAKLALRNNERPMTRYELVDAVEGAGLVVGGVDKGRNMGTILWRSKQFSNTGEGYWPIDDDPPVPADFHEPDEFDL
jgi:hypothetical protein